MHVRRFMAAGFTVALVGAAAVVVAAPAGAVAQTFTVTNTTDTGADTLRDVLENQIAAGDTVVLTAGATYTLDNCDLGDIDVDADVTIEGHGATVEQTCTDRIFDTSDALTISNATLTGGVSGSDGGAITSGSGALTLTGVRLIDNVSNEDGGAIDSSGDVTVTDSLIQGNRTGGDGGAIDDSEGGVHIRIVRSTIASNCAEGNGGAISSQSDDAFTLVNSTVTGNTSGGNGAIDGQAEGTDVALVYSDVVGNTLDPEVDCGIPLFDNVESSADSSGPVKAAAVEGANVGIAPAGTLSTFGSVIALPTGGENCGVYDETSATVSSGYNYSDDASCGLDAATDKQGAANPLLGALADNGGPTPTLLPQATSPLVDAIPTAACSGGDTLAGSTITTDQRGLVRPDVLNQKCDIGSVELQTELPPVIQPTFTG